MNLRPQIGEVWEKGGKRRTIDSVVDIGYGYAVWWNRRKKSTWCTTWQQWARGAVLIDVVKQKKEGLADRIAKAIEADICDRRGLKREFNMIDDETKASIRETWRELIQAEIDRQQ